MGIFSFFNKANYKPSQVETPRTLYSYSGGGQVNPETAMKVAAYYRGLIYISTQIAKLPWVLKKDNNKRVFNSVGDILEFSANQTLDSMGFRLLAIQTAINKGNFFAEIERDLLGKAVALHPMETEDLTLWRTPEGGIVYKVAGGKVTGEDVYLQPKDVFHIRNFHRTSDGLMGQGLVAYASEAIGTQQGGDRFANALFTNGGLPSGVLTVQGTLSDEAYERLKKTWKESTGGRNTGSAAILEEGTVYNTVSFSPEMLQFLGSRQFGISEIARFVGFSPSKLFDTTAATYSNIEHSNLEVVTDTLDAWARTFEMEANIKLLDTPKTRVRSELELYDVFRGDMNTRVNYFSKMMQSASITPNEIREKEGMTPYEGGEEFFLASNNFTPMSRVNDIIDSQISKSDPKEINTKDEENTVEKELQMAALTLLKRKTK